jgi:hypothetical protein
MPGDISCVFAGFSIWSFFLPFLHRWLFGASRLPA